MKMLKIVDETLLKIRSLMNEIVWSTDFYAKELKDKDRVMKKKYMFIPS